MSPARRGGTTGEARGARGRGRRDRRLRPGGDRLEARRLLAVAGDPAMVAAEALPDAWAGGTADRVSTDLLIGYNLATSPASLDDPASPAADDSGAASSLLTDDQGRVGVVVTTGDAVDMAPDLEALGMDVVSVLPEGYRVEGFLPWAALPAASDLDDEGLLGIIGVAMPEANVGLVTSQGVNVLEADRVQASTPGYTGAGVKVGVLSGSFNDLPAAGVQVIPEGPAGQDDQGRAMLPIVHDVAPGASLAFAAAANGEGQFAANIQALANAGANVITDDYTYYDEPMFQEGIIAQAIDNVVTN